MARSFPLPARFARDGWRLKIRDRERVEPPHVTLLFRTRAWRFGLRERALLDRQPDHREVPAQLLEFIEHHMGELIEAWDELYPHNKVRSKHARRC
jgi:hypothetical protein